MSRTVESERKANWAYSVLPINMAMGPISTFVQLYILELHGSVIDIGIAATLFNGVSIPAAMLWGVATDRFHRRKAIVVISYSAVAATSFLFLFSKTIESVEVLYAVFSFVSSAAATPINLIIMETEQKSRWTLAFATFSMISGVGVTLGMLLGVVWGDFLPLYLLAIPFAVLSAQSALMAAVMIPESHIGFEHEMIVMIRRSFYERLKVLPMLFLRIPRAVDFRRVFNTLRFELSRDPFFLYSSIVLFYFAAGVFNTSLIPSMYQAGITNSQIFLVFLIGMIVQTVSFNFVAPRVEKRSLRSTAVRGLVLRGLSYVFIGVSVYFLTGVLYLGSSLLLYPLAAGIAYAEYYAASNVMVFNNLGVNHQGSMLGVYSALVGLATMLGSFISGFASFYLGYLVTFAVSGILVLCAATLTSMIALTGNS
ncbi:MAG TPA: MFS transporter [Candidatus Saccharimonadales bacterium]|nr:MFS transporter [Candidatus Saccharimonadales bacterium]